MLLRQTLEEERRAHGDFEPIPDLEASVAHKRRLDLALRRVIRPCAAAVLTCGIVYIALSLAYLAARPALSC